MWLKMDLKPTAVCLFVYLNFCYVITIDMEEGSSCTLNDGSKGICLKRAECYQANKDMKSFLFSTFCSYNLWNPTVCCRIDCPIIQNRFFDGISIKMSVHVQFEVIMSDFGKMFHNQCLGKFNYPCNKLEKFKDMDETVRCYDSPTSNNPEEAETGGYDAVKDGYPHIALIGYGANPARADWICSGSIISEYLILTAAHCILNMAVEARKFAALGITHHTADPRYWQIYAVKDTIVYPEYKPPSNYHDIALLVTVAKIKYNLEVIPACLQRGEEMVSLATAIGWGAKGLRVPLADILKGVNLSIVSDKECKEAYPEHRYLINGYNSTTQVCYGDEQHIEEKCEGNSGGALQIKASAKKSKCLHIIIGVTSFGRACGNFGSSGLFSRISYYLPWIDSITGMMS